MISIALLALAAADPPPLPAGDVPPVRPRADLAQLFGAAGYPRAAVARGEQGNVGFRLVVAPNGRVTRCDIVQSSGSSALDEGTCRILRRDARFAPARDSAGNAVTDVVVSRVNWELPPAVGLSTYIGSRDYPGEALRRREQGRVEFELTVAPDGVPSGCRILASSGSASLDEATCRIMRERPRFTPARDSAGRRTSDTVRSRIVWILPTAPMMPITAGTGCRRDPRIPC